MMGLAERVSPSSHSAFSPGIIKLIRAILYASLFRIFCAPDVSALGYCLVSLVGNVLQLAPVNNFHYVQFALSQPPICVSIQTSQTQASFNIFTTKE